MPPAELSEISGQAGSVEWIIGALAAVVVALAGVIAYLFRLYNRRIVQHEKQRREVDASHTLERNRWIEDKAAWDAEREAEHAQLALTYEQKHRAITEQYISLSNRERDGHLEREEQIRKDNGELMDKIAAQAHAATQSMAELLQKMHDRFTLGGRRRGGQ